MDKTAFLNLTATRLHEACKSFVPADEQASLTPIINLVVESKAPASTSSSKHGAFDGGLAAHVDMVYTIASGLLGQTLPVLQSLCFPESAQNYQFDLPSLAEEVRALSHGSLFKVALIHDLNKVRTIDGRAYYEPNILVKGNRSEAKPWKVSDGPTPFQVAADRLIALGLPQNDPVISLLRSPGIEVREGVISLAVARAVSPELKISDQERNAIFYHDGAYAGRSGLTGNESALQILLHAADMLASRFVC